MVWSRALDAEFLEAGSKPDSLLQDDSHDGSLGAIATAGTLDKKGSTINDVLQTTGDGDTCKVLDDTDMEVEFVKQLLQVMLLNAKDLTTEVVWDVLGDRCLRPAAPGYLASDVSTLQRTTVDFEWSVMDCDNNLQFFSLTSRPFKHEMPLMDEATFLSSCLQIRGRN